MPGGNRERRLERNAAAVDKTNGVALLIKPMIHDDHAGNMADPAREAFPCVGLLRMDAAKSHGMGFPGREQNFAVRVGKSEILIRRSQLPASFHFAKGDLLDASAMRFEVQNIDNNDPVRILLVVTKWNS